MRRTLASVIAVGLIVPAAGVLTTAQLQAQQGPEPVEAPGGPRGPFRDGPEAGWLEEIDLTDEQIDQIRALRADQRDEMQALHEELWTARETMHDLMSGDATEAELRAQHEQIQILHRAVADKRFENMLAVRQIMTPEQRAELGERMEHHREFRQERRGDRGIRRGEGLGRRFQ
jgi:Spy/CpxP family protein refolding chaperone